MDKIKITVEIFNKTQEIYKEYDRGDIEDKYAVRKIINITKDNIILFNELIKIQDKLCEYPSNDALLEIMSFIEGKTEILGFHYETTDNYDVIVVKN